MTDQKIIRTLSIVTFAVLLIAFLIPLEESSRIVAAVLLVPVAVIVPLFIKKRNILSINKQQVLMLMSVISLVYLMLYYLSGIKFGFQRNPYSLNFKNFFAVICNTIYTPFPSVRKPFSIE